MGAVMTSSDAQALSVDAAQLDILDALARRGRKWRRLRAGAVCMQTDEDAGDLDEDAPDRPGGQPHVEEKTS